MTKEIKKLTSISMKTLGFSAKEIRKAVEDKGEAVFLSRIGGIASQFFTGESVNGEWVGFKGAFYSMKADGSVYEASVIFLPAAVAKTLKERLENGEVEVEVWADVYAQESDKNASGYGYICEPVLSESADNRKKEIAARIVGSKLPTALAIADGTKPAKTAKK